LFRGACVAIGGRSGEAELRYRELLLADWDRLD